MTAPASRTISLPAPGADDDLHVLLRSRRSVKRFVDADLPTQFLASALTAVAGPSSSGKRVVPSARSTYPVEVTVIVGTVDGLVAGSYRYDVAQHLLRPIAAGDHRAAIADSTLDAQWLAQCPAMLLLSADLDAARTRFDDQPADHGERFVWLETGCMAQNAYLWAAHHQLGTVLIAGLDDRRAQEATAGHLPAGHSLLSVLPLGAPAGN